MQEPKKNQEYSRESNYYTFTNDINYNFTLHLADRTMQFIILPTRNEILLAPGNWKIPRVKSRFGHVGISVHRLTFRYMYR